MKGLLKSESPKHAPQPFIDCTGDLQVITLMIFFVSFYVVVYLVLCLTGWNNSNKVGHLTVHNFT